MVESKHIPKGFTAEDLFQYLSLLTREERRREVFIRVGEKGKAFNIKSLDLIEPDTYSFFGVQVNCFVLSDERFAPKEAQSGDV